MDPIDDVNFYVFTLLNKKPNYEVQKKCSTY